MTVPKRIIKIVTVERQYDDYVRELEAYLCDNGEIYNKDELAAAIGMNANTLKVRFYRDRVRMFADDFLRPVGGATGKLRERVPYQGPKPKVAAWDRSKCKRNGVVCEYYSECQEQRLGLKGASKWEPPSDTDTCYEAVKIKNTLKAVHYP